MRSLLTVLAVILLALCPTAAATAATAGGGLAVAGSPAPSPSGPGGIGIRLLDIPASAQDDPRARTYIVDRLAPGAEIKRRVRVVNNTASTQTVFVYPGAAHITGGAFLGDDAGVKTDLTTWTRVAQPRLDLAPRGFAEVMTTIKVPADAAEGEQYGAIWAEVRSASNGAVVQANRVGVRIYLSVGSGNGKAADFSITSVTAGRGKDGSRQLSALVTNTGARALDITGDLTLTGGPGGLSAGPFSVPTATTVAPGKTQTVLFTPPDVLPNGPWTARIKLKSGLLERQATATLTFPDAGPGPAVVPTHEEGTPWTKIVAIAAIVLVLAALTAGWLLRRRRLQLPRRTRDTPPGARRGSRERAEAPD